MKIIVMGAGKVGFVVSKHLRQENHDITVIDNDVKVIERISNTLDVLGVCGNGANYQLLKDIGAPETDLLIAVTPTDELNMLACTIAKKLGVKHTVARVRDPEYAEQLAFLQDDLEFSMAINPEKETASEIIDMLSVPSALKAEKFADGLLNIIEIKISMGNILDGMQVKDFSNKIGLDLLICACERGNEDFIPNGDFLLKAGDSIHIISKTENLPAFFRKVGIYKSKPKSLIIIGGGKIGYYLARMANALKMKVKIIDIDEPNCRELADDLPFASVICGDGSDQELLHEEGLGEVDACVSLTGRDEDNIIISLYAKKCNTDKVIAKINNEQLYAVLETIGIHSAISPKHITASNIIRYVRSIASRSSHNTIKSLYNLTTRHLEGIEFLVGTESSRLTNRPIKELKLKTNLLIAGIIKGGKAIIPHGNDTLQIGDSVIVVVKEHILQELSDILE